MNDYDDAFNSAKLIPAAHLFLKNWTANSKQFQKVFKKDSKAQLDMPYGDKSSMRMDIFSPGAYVEANLLFVHGGFWTGYDKSVFSHFTDFDLPSFQLIINSNCARQFSSWDIDNNILIMRRPFGNKITTLILSIPWNACATAAPVSPDVAVKIVTGAP